MHYTVIGGRGFIGSKIVEKLEQAGCTVWVPKKEDTDLFSKNLGTVIYCAGHGDCNNGYLKVLESNTVLLAKIIEKATFTKLVYISSTRLYMGQNESNEFSDLTVLSGDPRRLFNLTKLVAEEILLKSNKNVVIVRPSNVYGLALNSPLFLPSIVRNAINHSKVDMYVSPEYAKDYVSVDDVASVTIKLAQMEDIASKVFNVASGENVTAREIANVLQKNTGCEIIWHENNVDEKFPQNNIELLKSKIDFQPKEVLSDLSNMISSFKSELSPQKEL